MQAGASCSQGPGQGGHTTHVCPDSVPGPRASKQIKVENLPGEGSKSHSVLAEEKGKDRGG